MAFLHVRAGKVGVKMSPLEQAFNCVYAAQLEGHILIPNTYHKDVMHVGVYGCIGRQVIKATVMLPDHHYNRNGEDVVVPCGYSIDVLDLVRA